MEGYISKERAKDLIVVAASGNGSRLAHMLSLLENEPSADVVEVVHARWIEDDCAFMRCSQCGYENDWEWDTPYCPQCGAKMDGGRKQ